MHFSVKKAVFGILLSCTQAPEMQMLAGMLRSAVLCPQMVRDKAEKSWHLGQIEGPFDNASLERESVSPVGIVPKKAPGKFRLLHYLSHPEGESVNDYTDSLLTSVSHVFNPKTAFIKSNTTHSKQKLGGYLLFKSDGHLNIIGEVLLAEGCILCQRLAGLTEGEKQIHFIRVR